MVILKNVQPAIADEAIEWNSMGHAPRSLFLLITVYFNSKMRISLDDPNCLFADNNLLSTIPLAGDEQSTT